MFIKAIDGDYYNLSLARAIKIVPTHSKPLKWHCVIEYSSHVGDRQIAIGAYTNRGKAAIDLDTLMRHLAAKTKPV